MASLNSKAAVCLLALILLISPSLQRVGEEPVDFKMDEIKQALWDSGFKIMSLIFEKQLRSALLCGPAMEEEFDRAKDRVTIFVPEDDGAAADLFKRWVHLRNQIVVYDKVDKEDFDSKTLVKGTRLRLSCGGQDLQVTQRPDTDYSINNVNITRWNIYNNGHLIIHGVETFFRPGDFGSRTFPINNFWVKWFLDTKPSFYKENNNSL